jgi:hypothetical protein
MTTSAKRIKHRIGLWFLEGMRESKRPDSKLHHKAPWWQVMCLTGVDYFSTLGYQPGIAYVAAGLLSPFATLIVVLLTLFGALPIYSRVAKESPHGQGSISMLEELLAGWRGKAMILCLLGFAATDFMITITLSAADAAAHVVDNPFAPWFMHDRIGVTMFLVALLGGIFLMGFREAISVSVLNVFLYLGLNAVVLYVAGDELREHPIAVNTWWHNLQAQRGSVWNMIGVSALLFPKLALGMSGFETGVAVMPLVQGDPDDTEENPRGRIRNTRILLFTAAVIMSFFLIGTSIITTTLIPAHEFLHGGKADGRAVSYLAHLYLGEAFGTVYDISSICILWFAGASAMAGLLQLVPRYLPRFGMAPEWAKAMRPLVCFFTAVAFAITLIFKADVDAQGGAYATGVLVLMTSAAFAVLLTVWREGAIKRVIFSLILAVFTYTSFINMIERPDGLKIASFFIAVILTTSLISRVIRSTELRVLKVDLDDTAKEFILGGAPQEVRIVAHRPGGTEYSFKELEARRTHNITEPLIFLEVHRGDASEFAEELLTVKGVRRPGGYKVLQCASPAVPNAIAALLLHIRDINGGKLPHVYFGWTEGHPVSYVLKYIFFGEGETAPLAREVLRAAEPDPMRRPHVHVG